MAVTVQKQTNNTEYHNSFDESTIIHMKLYVVDITGKLLL